MEFFVLHPGRIAVVTGILALAEFAIARGWRPSRAPADHGLLLAAGAWGLWALWEWLILAQSPEADIRIDLLLLVPFVAIMTLVGSGLEVRQALRPRVLR